MLKIVVSICSARAEPLLGDDGMGAHRFEVILGRKIEGFDVCRTRWMSRL